MPYDEQLEQRVDAIIAAKGWQFDKIKMFGSMAYKMGGKLCFTVRGSDLLLRVGGEDARRLLKLEGVTPALMGDREMRNWWQVEGRLLENDVVILKLLEQAIANTEGLDV